MDLPLDREILVFKSFKERIKAVNYLDRNLSGLKIKILNSKTIQVFYKEF